MVEFSIMTSNVENDFKKACRYVEMTHHKLSKDLLIELYALYKQATVGPCNIQKPSLFDFAARAKWTSWSKLGDMSSRVAMSSYVGRLSRDEPLWSAECSDQSENTGISVSSMSPEEDIPESEKNLFDWVRQGKLDNIKRHSKETIIEIRDENGLSVLHWACDRGHLDVTQFLVNQIGMDVNIRDDEKQTPLHYAAACGHIEVCTFLIKSNARTNVKDCNNQTPEEIAENDTIRKLLQSVATS